MINSNELFYVDKSVKKTPFPGKEYAIETMDMLNEAYQMYKDIFMDNEYKLKFSEFGTRRRFSYNVHDEVCKLLKEKAMYCTGTSNVHMAMRYNMKVMGTHPHEWFMFHGAEFGYKRAKMFIKEFNKKLKLNLSTDQIDKIININYDDEVVLKKIK